MFCSELVGLSLSTQSIHAVDKHSIIHSYFFHPISMILIEEITLIAQQHFPDSAYQKVTKTLSDAEVAAIEWIAIVINTWNRIAISSQYAVNP